jgi:hypothetical protein
MDILGLSFFHLRRRLPEGHSSSGKFLERFFLTYRIFDTPPYPTGFFLVAARDALQIIVANGRRKWSICVGSWRAATIIVTKQNKGYGYPSLRVTVLILKSTNAMTLYASPLFGERQSVQIMIISVICVLKKSTQ